MPEPHRHAEQPAVVVEADLDLLQLATLVRRSDEVLPPILGELHRPAERPRGHRNQHLLRPRVHDLHPETAADIRRDHLHLAEIQAELGGHRSPHPGRGLGGRPDAQPARVGIPAGQHSPALQRRGRRPFDREIQPQPVRRGGDRRRGVADLLHQVGRHVSRYVVVHQALGRPGRRHADHRGQRLIGHRDPLHRVLGQVAILRDHQGDRLADVVHLVPGQYVLGTSMGQRRMRDQQRQRVGQRSGQILVGVDGQQAVHLERGADVDVEDLRVRVRGTQHRHLDRVVSEVVQVTAVAGQQPGILDPLDRLADHPGGHAGSACAAG